jgi:hypothetical protein
VVTHPFTQYEIARARDEERLLRGLAAYRVRDERSAESVSTTGSGGRLRILDRLRRRDVRVTGSPARPAV